MVNITMETMSTLASPSQLTGLPPAASIKRLKRPLLVGKMLLPHTTLEATSGAMQGRNTIMRKKLRVLLDLNWLISVAMVSDSNILTVTVAKTKTSVLTRAL